MSVTLCAEMYEPVPDGHQESSWRLNTHTCGLPAGHEPPHLCPVCEATWSEPWPALTEEATP